MDARVSADGVNAEDFIQKFSHNLKNPLTAAIGSIDIIREGLLGPINEEQEEYLQSAIDSCHEVVMMLDNLIDIKKFSAGKIKMSIHRHNAGELINKVAAQFARQARHDGIGFSLELESGAAEIAVDSRAFTRVLENLLVNVLKSTQEGDKITVSSRSIPGDDLHEMKIPAYAPIPADFPHHGRFVKITVKASGNGIPADELEHVFNCDTTEQERSDTRLGLAYCKLAVESLHGTIWAESEAEEENVFAILLPCC